MAEAGMYDNKVERRHDIVLPKEFGGVELPILGNLAFLSGLTTLRKAVGNNEGFELEVTDKEQEVGECEADEGKVQKEVMSNGLQCRMWGVDKRTV